MSLEIRPAAECKYDELSLGEIMLRLDPGEGRTHTTRCFNAWEGGGEYNVARGLRRCFGLNTAVVTAFVKNPVGELLEDLILQGGVDTSFVRWMPFDGIGRESRNGLNFTERGSGLRAALGCSDRGNTAASQLKKGDIDFDMIFGELGVRWFHTGGIFAGLSESTPDVVIDAMIAAKKYGTVISYDLNYRPSLWKGIGGPAKAQEVNKEIAGYVDVIMGNEEDFTASLGFEVEGVEHNLSTLDVANFKQMIERVVSEYPNFKAAATTLRGVKSATINDWGAMCWYDGQFYEAKHRENTEILDRVGGGDSFASGFIYGMMALEDPQLAVEYGAAHGALAMTTAGDTSMARLSEVENLVRSGSLRVAR